MAVSCPACGLSFDFVMPVKAFTCPRCFAAFHVGAPDAGPRRRGRRARTPEEAWANLLSDTARARFVFGAIRAAPFQRMGAPATALLISKLRADEPRAVISAAWVLRMLADHGDTIAPALVDVLDHPHPLVRETVQWSLRRMPVAATAALLERLPDPTRRRASVRALSFLGRRAASALPRLQDMLERLDVHDAEPVRTAIEAITGPKVDPELPLPYLGERIVLTQDVSLPRKPERLWLETVEQHVLTVGDEARADAFTLDGWKRMAKLTSPPAGWAPDRVVLRRDRIRLTMYDFEREKYVSTTLVAKDRAAFTMGELLFKAVAAFGVHANCVGTRIFEGLRADTAKGTYYVRTGS